MGKLALACVDNSGTFHNDPQDAAIADLSAVLGRVGAESGITNGLAKMILEKRADIEKVFADLDEMVSGFPVSRSRSAS